VLARYLEALAESCAAEGLPEPLVMRSSGGVATIAEAADHPAFVLLSGPAAGAVGAALAARAAGVEDAVSLDMGGTSTDVALIVGGEVERAAERTVAGYPVRLPSVDLQTVGAGGGSIAWRDEGGALRVGPESAGAYPGPACYGRGGTRPTVTDANLVLGRLPETLAGGLRLDRTAAERALGNLDPEAVIRAVNAGMMRAVRLVSVERGHDPRGLTLVAFGGAGPLHACELAEDLELQSVLIPESAGVLSALGLAASDERRDFVRSYIVPLDQAGELPAAGEADLRYAGQSFELTVPLGPELVESFHRAHEERYGYADPSRSIELVAVRTAEVHPGPTIEPVTMPRTQMTGPDVLELAGATCWLPPGWAGVRDGKGAGWRLTRS
jgi:N-methylhydantoinase A